MCCFSAQHWYTNQNLQATCQYLAFQILSGARPSDHESGEHKLPKRVSSSTEEEEGDRTKSKGKSTKNTGPKKKAAKNTDAEHVPLQGGKGPKEDGDSEGEAAGAPKKRPAKAKAGPAPPRKKPASVANNKDDKSADPGSEAGLLPAQSHH